MAGRDWWTGRMPTDAATDVTNPGQEESLKEPVRLVRSVGHFPLIFHPWFNRGTDLGMGSCLPLGVVWRLVGSRAASSGRAGQPHLRASRQQVSPPCLAQARASPWRSDGRRASRDSSPLRLRAWTSRLIGEGTGWAAQVTGEVLHAIGPCISPAICETDSASLHFPCHHVTASWLSCLSTRPTTFTGTMC